MMNEEKQTPLFSADHPPKSKDSSTKQEPVDTSTKWDSTDQVRILLVGALYGPLGLSSPSARHLLQTLLKKLDGSTPGMRESPSTTAMVGLEAEVNQAEKSATQVNASKASQGLADVDMENYNTTGDSLANSQVPSIEDDDKTNNPGSSCQQEVMKDESAALPSDEISGVVPQGSADVDMENYDLTGDSLANSQVPSIEDDDETNNQGSSCQQEVMKDESAALPSNEINAVVPQGSADVDRENYDTTGDSLPKSQIPSIEDDDETNNKGSSCQQEVMKDESAALPSNEFNAVVPDQDSNSFYLRNVSMAAKNRVHNFVLDLGNTTSSQLNTSSHLNQSESTVIKSVEVAPDPVNEDSSSCTKVLMLSLEEKDSSESTAMSGESQVCASPVWDPPSSTARSPVNRSWSSPLISGISIDIDLKTTCDAKTTAENESSGEPTAASSGGSITIDLDAGVSQECASPVGEIHEVGNPPSLTAQSSVNHSRSAPSISGRSIDMDLKVTCVAEATGENETTDELFAPSSGGSIKIDLDTADKSSFSCNAGTSLKNERFDFSIPATSLDADSNQVIAKSSRIVDFLIAESPSLNDTKEQGPTWDSLGESRVSSIVAEVEASKNSILCERVGKSPSIDTQSHDMCYVDPLRKSPRLPNIDLENTGIVPFCCDGETSIENEISPCSKSSSLVAKISTGLENSNLMSKGDKRKRKHSVPELSEPSRRSPRLATGAATSTGEGISPRTEGESRKRKRSVPESLVTSEKETDESLQESQCLIMETNENQTDEPLPKVPCLAVEKEEPQTESSIAKVTIDHKHPPGEPTDSTTSTGKGISPQDEGKTRKRKRKAPESSDTSEKESEEPLRKSRCLVMEANEHQLVSPQAEEPASHENVARVKVENATSPEALEYAHLCIRNAYHALLGAGILESPTAVMASENVTIQPQAEVRVRVKPYKRKRRRRRN